jgi:2-polyprenyl-3-methyl-5-hydroxy-6-metoxy-1,4-benzoquinol methylase
LPLLSNLSRRKKLSYFVPMMSSEWKVLEVGSGNQWFGDRLKSMGFINYVSLDLKGPADLVGDIRHWTQMGIIEGQFDAIIAFEVVEHVDCFREFFDLLRPGGLLMLTSPLPHMDWACKLLEYLGLNQKRTSPHDHLIYFDEIPWFEPVHIKIVGFMAQWGVFRKPGCVSP